MSSLPAVAGQRLIKALRKIGFEVIRKKGTISPKLSGKSLRKKGSQYMETERLPQEVHIELGLIEELINF